MIEQVLEEIKIAEGKASEIRKSADEYALCKNKEAETAAAALLKNAETTAKAMKQKAKETIADKEGALYAQILSEAEKDSATLYSSLKTKIEELSEEIVGKVINGDC